jgi:hypothetical protein
MKLVPELVFRVQISLNWLNSSEFDCFFIDSSTWGQLHEAILQKIPEIPTSSVLAPPTRPFGSNSPNHIPPFSDGRNKWKWQVPILEEPLVGCDGEVVRSSTSSITARSHQRCTTATFARIHPITILVLLPHSFFLVSWRWRWRWQHLLVQLTPRGRIYLKSIKFSHFGLICTRGTSSGTNFITFATSGTKLLLGCKIWDQNLADQRPRNLFFSRQIFEESMTTLPH